MIFLVCICIYEYTSLFINFSVDGHLECFYLFWLLGIIVLWTWAYKYLFQSLLSILLGVYPKVELLDHTVIPCLIVWGTSILFSTGMSQRLHHFTLPPAMRKCSIASHLANANYFLGFRKCGFLSCSSTPCSALHRLCDLGPVTWYFILFYLSDFFGHLSIITEGDICLPNRDLLYFMIFSF